MTRIDDSLVGGRARRQNRSYLEARWSGSVIVSYAQNAEDVRLWRVLGWKPSGFYVDVGAGDPIADSVTKLFYDNGWSGVNIEPGPAYELLSAARPRDISLELAISSDPGEAELLISHPDPGLSSFTRLPDALLPDGFTLTPKRVRTSRLEDVLKHYAPERSIDFLKIDVEGAERDVLESFDPRTIHPAIVVVEAISPLDNHPTHEEWEKLLLDAGYLFAAFDGVNRFYVPVEHEELAAALAYPISTLDRYVMHGRGMARDAQADDGERQRRRAVTEREESEIARLEAMAHEAKAALVDIENTVSWRITKPLRTLRRLQLQRSRHDETPISHTATSTARLEAAFANRLDQVANLLAAKEHHDEQPGPDSIDHALARLEAAMSPAVSPEATSWLALLTVDGSYPCAEDVDSLSRRLRTSGPRALLRFLRERFFAAVDAGTPTPMRLDVVRHGVLVDVSHVVSSDIHTGIQRVARETVSRWIQLDPLLQLVSFDERVGAFKLLSENELQRMRRWRENLNPSGRSVSTRLPQEASGNALVPWDCKLIIPELPNRHRSRALRALAISGVHESLSLIAFDLTPVVAAESFPPGVAEAFCDYLSLVKRSDRISAISRQSADDFRAFATMLAGEGLQGPAIRAHPLPAVAPMLTDTQVASARDSFALRGLPLVLVVGSLEPRKNHLVLLEAAEHLWKRGLGFELLLVAGSSWESDEFDRYAEKLTAGGRPINVYRRATEAELWAAYRLARFSVFPSLLEGFGLPVAESLAAGTPVITSRHGSMAEIAAGGGALVVDPRSVEDLEENMRLLLEDDDLLERLRREACTRDMGTWDRYARDVWHFFVEESE